MVKEETLKTIISNLAGTT